MSHAEPHADALSLGRGAEEPPPAASLATISLRGARPRAEPRPYKLALRPSAPAEAAAPAAPSAPRGPSSIEELAGQWLRLRSGSTLPSPAELDFAAVARRWPNTVLLSFEAAPGEDNAEATPQAVRLSGHGGDAPSERPITLTPMVASWVVDLARHALRGREMVRDGAQFPGIGRLEAIVLPLSLYDRPDHVLYHLRRG